MRLVSLVLGFVLAGLLACGREPTPPNIVLVIGDDHGYTDFGFMGSPIAHTPELDRLAQEGVAFTHGFNTSSACRNSLLSMLTGLHPIQWDARRQQLLRAGIVHAENQLITEFATLPRLLGERGYVSFQAGKYWEGAFSSGGFDAGTTEPLPDAVVNETGGLPELSGGRGLGIGRSTMEPVFEFLEAERDGPFFLWFAPMLPHLPHNPKPRDLAPYENHRLTDSARLYYGTITRFDRTVSRLLDALRERDLLEETLVVYLTDNGWDQRPGYSREGQLDGPRGKKSIYELGFRTPIVFHWPRSIAGGRRFDAPVSTVDVFTTLLDVAGAKPPPDRMGRSLWPSVARGEDPPDETLIESTHGTHGVRFPLWVEGEGIERRATFLRTDQWRYVQLEERGAEGLFRIGEDPSEIRDVSTSHATLVQSFREQVEAWKALATRPYSDVPER